MAVSGERSESPELKCLTFRGSVRKLNVGNGRDIEALTLLVTYWPDKAISDGYAEIIRVKRLHDM